MPDHKASILIVEDEELVRTSLAEILKILGHRVRCAADGFAALVEINEEVPEILLSDLNMPGMSGSELLPLIRLQFPIVRVIAMSGAFSGDQVPDGVAADAFYEKGNGVAVLLKAIERLSSANRQSCEGPEPTWILRNGQDIKRAMPIQGRYPPDGNASSIPPLPIPIGA
jgi:CheY-like chemotaxis protein